MRGVRAADNPSAVEEVFGGQAPAARVQLGRIVARKDCGLEGLWLGRIVAWQDCGLGRLLHVERWEWGLVLDGVGALDERGWGLAAQCIRAALIGF